MIFVAITGVFVAEMFNTVIEICVDLASPNYHPLAKIAKGRVGWRSLAKCYTFCRYRPFCARSHTCGHF